MAEVKVTGKLDSVEGTEFHFDFGAYDITEAEAYDLMYKFIGILEELDARLGGGCGKYSWEDFLAFRIKAEVKPRS